MYWPAWRRTTSSGQIAHARRRRPDQVRRRSPESPAALTGRRVLRAGPAAARPRRACRGADHEHRGVAGDDLLDPSRASRTWRASCCAVALSGSSTSRPRSPTGRTFMCPPPRSRRRPPARLVPQARPRAHPAYHCACTGRPPAASDPRRRSSLLRWWRAGQPAPRPPRAQDRGHPRRAVAASRRVRSRGRRTPRRSRQTELRGGGDQRRAGGVITESRPGTAPAIAAGQRGAICGSVLARPYRAPWGLT